VPQPGDPLHGDPVTFLDAGIGPAVATVLDAAGGKDVNLIGANVAAQAVDAGLVEHYAAGGVATLRLRPRVPEPAG
jgi:hypothetical protein